MKRISLLFILVILILLVGCKGPVVEPVTPVKGPEIVEEANKDRILTIEEQEVIVKEYYELLQLKSDNIIAFVDENISNLDEIYVDEVILTFEEYLKINNPSIKEISSKLNKYYDYSSGEIKSYLDILNKEAESIFTDGEEIRVSLDELLERAKMSEIHLREYIGKVTYNKVYDLYENYLVGAILGSGNQYIYANEGYSTIREDVLKKYNSFIENNQDSFTSNILSKYLEELKLDEMDMNGVNVLKFYEDIRDIIKYELK